MKALFVFLVCLSIPMGASGKTVSFDQHVFDKSTFTCYFGVGEEVEKTHDIGNLKKNIIIKVCWGHGEAMQCTFYVCDQKYTTQEQIYGYSKKTAEVIDESSHIDAKALLGDLDLTGVTELPWK